MPFQTTWEPRGIVWVFHGDVTAQEIEDANVGFYNDPRSDTSRYQIIDATDVTSVEWSERDITETAAQDIGAAEVIENLKVAYVARDQEIVSKLEKYIDLGRELNTSWQFKGFEDIRSAREWATA